MEVLNTKNNKENKKYTILIYGNAGTGKSLEILNFENPFIFSLENGLLTLADYDLPYVKIKTWLEFEKNLKEYFADETLKNTTLVIDSLTTASEFAYEHFNKTLDKDRDAFRIYSEVGNSMLRICNFLHQCNRPVYLIAQSDIIQDENKKVRCCPLFVGNMLGKKIPHIFDFVFAKKIENEKYVIQVVKDATYEAKSRHKLSKKIYNNMKEIFAEIYAG